MFQALPKNYLHFDIQLPILSPEFTALKEEFYKPMVCCGGSGERSYAQFGPQTGKRFESALIERGIKYTVEQRQS